MKLTIEHSPGELRERLPEVLRALLEKADADGGAPLAKGGRSLDDSQADFRFAFPRGIFSRARQQIRSRQTAAVADIKKALR